MTATERWIRRFDAAAAEGVLIQGPDLSVSDLRLAADCIAFVRDFAAMKDDDEGWDFSDHVQFPHDYEVLAVRIKEASP